MRRKHCEITDKSEINRILSTASIGRLATNGANGYPYITPVNFVYYKGCIFFHSAPEGEKLENIQIDSRVCFQVDIPLAYLDSNYFANGSPCSVHQFYHSVIIRGEARVLSDSSLKVDALNALSEKYEKTSDFPRINNEMSAYKACSVVEIKPREITGKTDLHQNKSDEERLAIARYLKARGWLKDRDTIEAFGFDQKNI